MKKIFFTFISFVLLIQTGKAQSFIHFPDSAMWNIRYHYGQPPYYYVNYKLVGDTILGAFTYKKLMNDTVLAAVIREDTVQNKVFAKNFHTSFFGFNCDSASLNCLCADSILLDYNLLPGDTFTGIFNTIFNNNNCTYKVLCRDSVYFGNTWRKRWSLGQLSNNSFAPPCYEGIIEGIGSPSGIIEAYGLGINGEISELMCFGTESQSIYPASSSPGCQPLGYGQFSWVDAIHVFPNPFSESFILQSTTQQLNKSTIAIFNSLGDLIFKSEIRNQESEIDLSSYPKGIYFLKVNNSNKMSVKKIVKL